MTRREEPWHVVVASGPVAVGWVLRTGGFSGAHGLAMPGRTLCGLPLPGPATGLNVQTLPRITCQKCLAATLG
jgi:hypothetical protein